MEDKTIKECQCVCVRERLLAAAMEIFAQKGYHETTISDISKKAQANVAAVNYYFGSKDNLYIEVWKTAFEETLRAYPPDGGLGDDASDEEKLKALIYAHTWRMMDPSSYGLAGSIVIREMVQPTEVIQSVRDRVLEPLHRRSSQIIRNLLGPGATDKQILLCCLSIIHQCLAFGVRRLTNSGIPIFLKNLMEEPDIINEMAEHVYRFSLGGIYALRQQLESRGS